MPSPRHFLSVLDLTAAELAALLDRAAALKADRAAGHGALAGRTVALLFMKPSTRTRVSFQVGVHELGGHAVVLNASEMQLGRGETLGDTANVFSRYASGIMARVFGHADLEALAAAATVPVINGLSDLLHPCQALADYFTMRERFGDLRGLRVAYVGDGNNVAHSLANGAARLGAHLAIATPGGRYAPDPAVIDTARRQGAATGATIDVTTDAGAAVEGARVVYTDTFTSMGQEAEAKRRLADLADYRVDAALMARAAGDAIFMHCLPAHRGEEVTPEVIDGPRSVVFDQAENRLHAQKALMELLIT